MTGLHAFAVAGFLALSATAGLAETLTLDGVSFDVPEGWERQDSQVGVLLMQQFPKTEDASMAAGMIQIVPVGRGPDTLDANVADMVALVPEFVDDDPMTDSAGTTAAGHRIKVQYRCCEYRGDISMGQSVAGVAAQNGQLLASLVFMNIASDHEDTASADFEALVRSIRFEGDSVSGLTPAEGDGGLEGVFTHLDFGLMPNVFGGLDFQSDNQIAMFDPGGLFSTTIPPGGRSVADYCAETPRDCGTYRLKGGGWFGGADEIEMRSVINDYGVIKTETMSFAREGENLKIDDGDYRRMPPFEDGTRFNGRWTYVWASSGMTAMGSGGVASQQTLILSPDGRFSRDGWSGGMNSNSLGGVTVSSTRPTNQGTYTVSGYTLTLTNADGTTEKLSIFEPDIGSDELLVIDGNNFLKDEDSGAKKKGG